MPKLLTVAAVAKLVPDKTKRREIRDGGAPGLYLCIFPSGNRSWVLRGRRPDGRQSKTTLGVLDLSGNDTAEPELGAPLSLRGARILANRLLGQRAKGKDIAEAKVELGRARSGEDTFASVARAFVEDHARPKNRGWRIAAKTLGLHYSKDATEPTLIAGGLAQRWSTRLISEIDADAVHGVITETQLRATPGIAPRTSGASNARGLKMAKTLAALFAWATRHRRIAANPVIGLPKPDQGAARDRVLTTNEIRQLWAACDELGYPFGDIIRMLILTAARRTEVSAMRLGELNEDFSVWTIGSARTKNKKVHVVWLPPLAQSIIKSVPRRANSDFVFTLVGTPVSGFSKIKSKLDQLMKPSEPWRLHDIRRTAVTHMAALGVAPHVIESAVGHASGFKSGIAGVYNRFQYAVERKAALEQWGAHVESVVA